MGGTVECGLFGVRLRSMPMSLTSDARWWPAGSPLCWMMQVECSSLETRVAVLSLVLRAMATMAVSRVSHRSRRYLVTKLMVDRMVLRDFVVNVLVLSL